MARIKLSSGAGAILLAASSLAVAAAWVYGFPLWLDQQSLWNGWGFLAMAGGALFWLELSRRLIGHVWKSNSQIFAKRLACLVFVASVFNPIVCFWMADNSAGAAVIRFLQTMSSDQRSVVDPSGAVLDDRTLSVEWLCAAAVVVGGIEPKRSLPVV